MERIRCQCVSCGSRFQVPAGAAKKDPRCPKCGAPLAVLPPGGGEAPGGVEVQCFNCDASFRVPAGAAGGEAACPRCGKSVSVEPEGAAPAGEDLLPPPPPPGDRRLERVLMREPPSPPPAKKFAMCLDTVFIYPFTGLGGVIFLAFMAPVWAVLRAGIIPFSWLFRIIVGGYLAAYMFSVLYETSMGKNRAPGSPGGADFGELFGYFFRFFGATFVAFAPAIALLVYLAFSAFSGGGVLSEGPGLAEAGAIVVLLGVFCLFGTLYYPMALMLIGFAESWWAGFNYVFGVRSILRIPLDYFICAVFFVVSFGAAVLLEGFWVAASGATLGGRIMALLATTVIELYLWVVQMRVLGLLYVTNKERLGWFR